MGRQPIRKAKHNMRKKCNILAVWSFIIALAIYVFTFYLYHYWGADGSFGTVYYETAQKPFVTLLFGIWGVTFHFAGVMSLLIGKIFFSEKKK